MRYHSPQFNIIGIFTNEAGQALAGFAVAIKASTKATTTNETGNFSLCDRSNDTLFNFKNQFKAGKGGGINRHDYFIRGSSFEGQPIAQYNSQIDFVANTLIPIPWLAHGTQNPKKSLRNGILSKNNLAISKKREVSDKRFSVSEMFQKGTVSNIKLGNTNCNFLGGVNTGKK